MTHHCTFSRFLHKVLIDEGMPSSEPGVMTQHWPSRLSSASDQVAYPARSHRVICIWLTSFRPIRAQVTVLLLLPLVGHRVSCKNRR
jgi:hypothetical protein